MVCTEAFFSRNERRNWSTDFSTVVRGCFILHPKARNASLVASFCLGSGMMFLVDVLQAIKRQVGIHLSGGNIRMTKDGLHSTKVGTVFYHVGSATVTKHMRTGMSS